MPNELLLLTFNWGKKKEFPAAYFLFLLRFVAKMEG